MDRVSPYPTRQRTIEMRVELVDLLAIVGCLHVTGINHTFKQDLWHLLTSWASSIPVLKLCQLRIYPPDDSHIFFHGFLEVHSQLQ